MLNQSAGTDWKIGGTGDFDGDGYTDIIWYNPSNGAKVIWWMQSTNIVGSAYLNLSNSSKVVTVGDFNNDNVPDIVMYDDTAYTTSIALSTAQGRSLTFNTILPVTRFGTALVNNDNDWKIVEAGDFDLDGHTDLLLHHETIGFNAIWPLSGSAYVEHPPPTSYTPFLCLQQLDDTDWKYISQDPQRSTWRLQITQPLIVTAAVNPSPITLTFNIPPTNFTYTIERKLSTATSWPTPLQTGWTSMTYTDASAQPGFRYDYRVKRVFGASVIETTVKAAAISGPVFENRGKALIIVDTTLQSVLTTSLNTLRKDLVADGWDVPAPFAVPRHVDYPEPPTNQPASTYFSLNNSANIATVTNIIGTNKSTTRQTAVILIGHVPVPYSGLLNSDGHNCCTTPDDHVGAWASDLYYSTVNSTWHDSGSHSIQNPCNTNIDLITSHTNCYWGENSNYIPGDGKFDEDFAPGPVDVAVGRVDFARLASFTRTEANLITDYLNKVHCYRYCLGSNNSWFQPGAVMLNNFSYVKDSSLNKIWAQYTISTMNSIYGPNALITVADPYRQPQTKSFMWGFASGYGNQNLIYGGGDEYSSGNLATTIPEARIGFYVLYGSYFGDFNKYDDFMRATIATPNSGLAAIWGLNGWALDSMSIGDTLGSCLVRTANTLGNNPRELAIMGDPTLRLPQLSAPGNLVLSPAQPVLNSQVTVTWDFAPGVPGLAYNIYSSMSPYGPFNLRGTRSITPGTFTENASGTYYMVRAFFTAGTPASGSYVEIGIGAIKR